jgi:mannose/fructose/N-acetylgalactosamine-specific phosphotransferase system component IIC
MTAIEAGALIGFGAVAFLDQWPVLQSMISRPIVIGPVVGAILGDPGGGVLWGAVLEAMQLAVLPVGAARYPDAALAGLLGTTAAVTGAADGVYPAAWAVAIALAAGWGGDTVGRAQRRWNGRTAERVRARVAAGHLEAPGRGIAVALIRGAAIGAAQVAVGLAIVAAGSWLLRGSPWAGPLDARGLRIAAGAMIAVGGVRAFGLGRRRAVALGLGVAMGVGLVAWGGVT